MFEFRKRHHDGIWHWSPECPQWPGTNFQRMFGDRCPEGNRCMICGQRAGSMPA